MSKHHPYPARETQILVHGDPDLKVKSKTVGHQLNEVGFTTRNTDLTDPDPKAGANCGELRAVIVGSQGEKVGSQGDSMLTQKPGRVRVDKAYDADALIDKLMDHGVTPVIPPKANRKDKRECDFALYRERNLVERFFNKTKRFRGIATRYDKLARNYLAAV